MPTSKSFASIFGINDSKLSYEEKVVFDALLLVLTYEELIEFFRNEYKDYFRFINFSIEMENNMLEKNLLRLIINDILLTKEYTVDGIVNYTSIHEDCVHDLIIGKNNNPSINLFRRIIELHRSVRQDIYKMIIKKITMDFIVTEHF